MNAQARLGASYYMGQGVEKSVVEARKWFRKAAEQGDERAKKFLELTEEDATK